MERVLKMMQFARARPFMCRVFAIFIYFYLPPPIPPQVLLLIVVRWFLLVEIVRVDAWICLRFESRLWWVCLYRAKHRTCPFFVACIYRIRDWKRNSRMNLCRVFLGLNDESSFLVCRLFFNELFFVRLSLAFDDLVFNRARHPTCCSDR